MNSSQLSVVGRGVFLPVRLTAAAVLAAAAAVLARAGTGELDAAELVARRGHGVPERAAHGAVVALGGGGLDDQTST